MGPVGTYVSLTVSRRQTGGGFLLPLPAASTGAYIQTFSLGVKAENATAGPLEEDARVRDALSCLVATGALSQKALKRCYRGQKQEFANAPRRV